MNDPGRLKESPARHVKAVLAHVDRLLASALAHAGVNASGPFAREYDDFSADEIFLLGQTAREIRTALVALLDRLGIAREIPTIPSRWAAQTDWQLAEVALAELADEDLAAWGDAGRSGAEAGIAEEAGRLRRLIARARSTLADGDGGRRADPESLAPGPALEPLRRLLKLRGLAPLHGDLRAFAERLRDPDLVLGVFGRVSTGKSSLINAVLDEDALPVGAAPVTRRLVRLRHGEHGLHLHAGDRGEPVVKPWTERDSWLERTDDERTRYVLRTPCVPSGLAWLDTPGLGATEPLLGAVATRAARECDAMILCVGAGALPGLDEHAVLERAAAQAIPVHLVVAQADRLRSRELEALMAWLAERLAPRTASIGAVSVSGTPGLAHLQALVEPLAHAPRQTRTAVRTTRLRKLLANARRLTLDSAHDPAAASATIEEVESAAQEIVRDAVGGTESEDAG